MKNLITTLYNEIKDSAGNENWERQICSFSITSRSDFKIGMIKTSLNSIDFNGNTVKGDKRILMRSNELRSVITEQYETSIKNKDTRFNSLNIIIFPNGNFEKIYFWDLDKIKEDYIISAKYFYQWTNDTMMNCIFDYELENSLLKPNYDEDGDLIDYQNSWDKGIFEFTLNNNSISHRITLYKNESKRELPMPLPEYFIKGFLEHHNITNTELTEDWKPWNKLTIKSLNNSIPYDKWKEYAEYSLESIVE